MIDFERIDEVRGADCGLRDAGCEVVGGWRRGGGSGELRVAGFQRSAAAQGVASSHDVLLAMTRVRVAGCGVVGGRWSVVRSGWSEERSGE